MKKVRHHKLSARVPLSSLNTLIMRKLFRLSHNVVTYIVENDVSSANRSSSQWRWYSAGWGISTSVIYRHRWYRSYSQQSVFVAKVGKDLKSFNRNGKNGKTDRGALSLWGTVFSNATWLLYIDWFSGFFLNLTLLILMSKQKFKHNP